MGQVYDPILKRVISDVEADALNQQRRAHSAPPPVQLEGPIDQPGMVLGIEHPGGDDSKNFGLTMPPMAQEDAESMFQDFPQIIGLLAQLVPQLRGAKAAVAIPSAIEAARQWWEGEEIDPVDIGVEGMKGLTARAVGRGVEKVGEKGVDLVTRSLSLGGKSDAAIEALPQLAIKEGAKMTKEGANAIRAAGTRRLANGVTVKNKAHLELADALDEARRKFQTAPNRITFWPQEAMANAIRQAPRELAIGRRMAAPFGVSTSGVIAPAAQTLMHLKLIQLANAMGDGEEPPLEGSRGPVRRTLR